ncbi:uncharacterized protein METZ01_LOCUS345477, partial [marine metagenome]
MVAQNIGNDAVSQSLVPWRHSAPVFAVSSIRLTFYLIFFECALFDALPGLAHVVPPNFESGPTRPFGHLGQAARNSRFTGRLERRGA